MKDDGEKDDRRATTRQCALTRSVLPVSDLLRFVAGPDNALVPDIRNRLPGRGVWICNSAGVLREAIKKKVFSRALKSPVIIAPDLEASVSSLLRRDALQMLSLANKAGAVTPGFAKVEGMRGPMLALVQASDGSMAEIARLAGLVRTRGRGGSAPESIRLFSADELGLSLGREHVIHAALNTLEAAAVFVERARRLVKFETSGPGKPEKVGQDGPSGIPVPPRDAERSEEWSADPE